MNEIDDLLSELGSGDDGRAEAAAKRLAQLDDAALPRLRPLLDSKDLDERWWAVRTCAEMPHAPVELLAHLLRDESSEVRAAAALGLTAHPAREAAPQLVLALEDEDSLVSALCVDALVSIGADAVEALLEAFPAASPRGRIQIMRTLAALKDTRAIRTMLQATEDKSAMLNYWAQQGLDALGVSMVYLMPK